MEEEFVEPESADFDVTCTTEGCHNEGLTLRVPAVAESPTVICGPCGVMITDVVPVEEDPEESE